MRVLTVNSGSSSTRLALVEAATGARISDHFSPLEDGNMTHPLRGFLAGLAGGERPQLVAHRIVHGGERFRSTVRLDDEVLARLADHARRAPTHAPQALALMEEALRLLPGIPQVALFDTAFHASLPARAHRYALPSRLCEELGIRRFGFHGLSHEHVMQACAAFVHRRPSALKVISCHLGHGASVAAIEHGICVDTSMGMTPLEGLVMGTRAGDLDPGVLLALLHSGRYSIKEIETLLYAEAGLEGMTGSADLRRIEARAAEGDEACRTALAVYGHRVRKYIGAYAVTMGGVDILAFTGGVGEHSAAMRSRCVQRLAFLGATLDEDLNRRAAVSRTVPVIDVSDATSRVRILVVAADEEAVMARNAVTFLRRRSFGTTHRVPIAVSARHAHLSRKTLELLFGADFQLHRKRPLAQPGQFATEETVSVIGPRGRLDRVRLIGPARDHDQVEISKGDEFMLGVDAPVRDSGDLAGTPGVIIEGPAGTVQLASGLICARRHIHMTLEDAERMGLSDGSTVDVRLGPPAQRVTFEAVRVRVSGRASTQLHLDADEANAARVADGDEAELLLGSESER